MIGGIFCKYVYMNIYKVCKYMCFIHKREMCGMNIDIKQKDVFIFWIDQ